MFEALIRDSGPRSCKQVVGGAAASMVLHAALITGAVVVSIPAGSGVIRVNVDTSLVFLAEQPAQTARPAAVSPTGGELGASVEGFQSLVAPLDIPTVIPPVNMAERWNAADYTGVGVEGGAAASGGTGVLPAPAGPIYAQALVDEPPVLLLGPALVYPPELIAEGIQGQVVMQAVLDTLGRVEPRSLVVLESPDPRFDRPSRKYLLGAVFRPARLRGRAVRVVVVQTVAWQLAGGQ